MALSASGLSIVDGFGPGFMWWIHLVFTYNILQLIAPGTWFFPLPGFTAHMQPTQTLPNSPWLIGISRQRCRLLRLVDSGFYIAYIYIYILIYLFVYLFIYIYVYLFNRYRNIFTYPVYDHDISTHIHMSMAQNTGDHGQPRGFVLIIVGKSIQIIHWEIFQQAI
jgi:ABC-type multidrug transport system fused ATPase/permease subunit